MTRLGILGVAALALVILASDTRAQRRGGAVSGGVRGAAVGGMVGGSGGAATGAKVGAVTGATRAAINRETEARTAYEATAEYQNFQHSNFNEVPPDVLGTTPAGTPTKPSGEAVIRRDGKPIVGITFPADWKQEIGDNYVSAVSKDGEAYSMLATLDKVADQQAGIKQIKTGLGRYLQDIKFDEQTETKGGALMITGTGKGKKGGVDVVFAVGVFDAGKGQLVGAAFVVDSKIEDHYKETVGGICQTIRAQRTSQNRTTMCRCESAGMEMVSVHSVPAFPAAGRLTRSSPRKRAALEVAAGFEHERVAGVKAGRVASRGRASGGCLPRLAVDLGTLLGFGALSGFDVRSMALAVGGGVVVLFLYGLAIRIRA